MSKKEETIPTFSNAKRFLIRQLLNEAVVETRNGMEFFQKIYGLPARPIKEEDEG